MPARNIKKLSQPAARNTPDEEVPNTAANTA
ncbi:hypothetical protein ABAC402_07275 [Asticcacaulis sp. AC402]|nr:hypothetical protein ABAC402_07275 [Asticcacaulis sp. AC402]